MYFTRVTRVQVIETNALSLVTKEKRNASIPFFCERLQTRENYGPADARKFICLYDLV